MPESRTILSHVSPEDFEPHARAALEALGYEIVAAGNEQAPADLWLVDDKHFEIDSHTSSAVPVIVLSRDAAPPPEDPCVVDVLRSPARFCSLYVALQTALEADPRRFPRVTTARSARSVAGDQICIGSIVSLSEGGCLFRSHVELPTKPEIRLYFSLPGNQMLTVRARTAYQKTYQTKQGGELGLEFVGLGSAVRAAIDRYVLDQLLAK